MPITLETLKAINANLDRTAADINTFGEAPPIWNSYKHAIRRAAPLQARVRELNAKLAELTTAEATRTQSNAAFDQLATEAIELTNELIKAWRELSELANENESSANDWLNTVELTTGEADSMLDDLRNVQKLLADHQDADHAGTAGPIA